MIMSNLVNKNVIVPEVYAQLVREKIKGKVKVAQCAENLGAIVNKEVGETITFPVWKYIGDAADIVPGTAMTSVEMEQSNSTATVKMIAAKGVKVNDYDNVTALGRALEEGASQQAEAIARKLDTDLIADALTSAFKKQIAAKGTITEDELLDCLALYGDDRDTADFHAIVAHSNFAKSFYKMEGFVKKDTTYVADGNGIVINGVIGTYMGIPVVLSDRLYDATNTEGFLLFIKKGSLGFMPKENPFVEESRDASTRTTTVFASQIYATKLTDEAGVVIAKTVVA
jgi:hypothetical protein